MSIKNIHRNSFSDTPTTIKRKVDNNLYDIKKAYTKINGNLVLVWDITENNEYLKVSESYIGQKFLERYYSQSIYTSVYWVHEVDGIITETYLSTNELNSWECTTLEPYYYTDGDKQYVGYYQTPIDSGFGQHDMKITYKSPDTGKILEIEYPVYYLEEKSFALPFTVYDWYPFRNPFAFYSLGKSTVLYQCKDKKGKLIEDKYSVATSITEMAFRFPEISNAQYKFAENQTVEVYYISVALKEYTTTFKINIRPYYDTRNNECNYSGTSTRIKKYYYKNLSPVRIRCDLSKKSYYGNLTLKEHTSTEKADAYYVRTLGAIGYKQNDTFYFYNTQNQVENIFNQKGQVIEYDNTIDIRTIGGSHKTDYLTAFSSNTTKYNNYTIGFAYWGDGTFSQVILTDKFSNNSLTYANKTGTIYKNEIETLKLRNGYVLNGSSKQYAYLDNPVFDCIHTYTTQKIHSVEITCAYPCKCSYEDNNNFYSDIGSISGGEIITTTYCQRTMANASTIEQLYSSTDENDWLSYVLHISGDFNSSCIVEFGLGETAFFNYQKNDSNVVQNSGYENLCKFSTNNRLNNIFENLVNLQQASIPQISKTYNTNDSLFLPFTDCINVEIINYSGSTKDFINLTDKYKTNFVNSFNKGQNIRTLELIRNNVTINCNDGMITLESLEV